MPWTMVAVPHCTWPSTNNRRSVSLCCLDITVMSTYRWGIGEESDGLLLHCSISSPLALEILQCSTNPLKWYQKNKCSVSVLLRQNCNVSLQLCYQGVNRWLIARPKCLQSISTRDTTVFHKAIKMITKILPCFLVLLRHNTVTSAFMLSSG